MRALMVALMGLICLVQPLAAHEVQPAIADFSTENGQLDFSLSFNAEPILAGVDLEGVADTNDTDGSDAVDALRVLEPGALEERLRAALPEIEAALNLQGGDAPIALTLETLEVGPVGNVDLPRESTLRWTGALPEGAETLSVAWPAAYGALVLRQQGVEEPFTGYLDGGEGSGPIQLGGGDAMSGWQAFGSYIPVGFDHIVPKGLDHILFVLGLFFLSTRLGPLLWQVTAFTLAHTVTLALGALGWVNLPGSIVEPLIAASIVFVAVENILSDGLSRWRPWVVFGFGLLHGLGFASVLGEFGLPDGQFIPALLGFNLGVEVGQLAVIAVAFLIVWLAISVDKGEADTNVAVGTYAFVGILMGVLGILLNTDAFAEAMGAPAPIFLWPVAGLCGMCILSAVNVDKLDAYRRFVAIPASAAIGLVGAWWVIERVFL